MKAVVAISAMLSALVIYALTASRSVGWHDSAELALSAWGLGASHAPGSPLHSIFGYFATRLFSEPHHGTLMLSLIPACMTVGVFSYLACLMTRRFVIPMLSAAVYAFSYQVWANAVVTEVYSLSALFLSLTFLFAWVWRNDLRDRNFFTMLAFYYLAMGTYFANILLAPAFVYLIWVTVEQRQRYLLALALTMALALFVIGMANYLLALNLEPFGEISPDSIKNIFLYMSGSQHAPLQLDGPDFLIDRILEHVRIFARSLLWLGAVIAMLGLYYLDRQDRGYGGFMFGVFAIYFGYYTIFGPGDYFLMVVPAYFVAVIWIAVGAAGLARQKAFAGLRVVSLLVLVFVVVGLFVTQFNGRRDAAYIKAAEEFAYASFDDLPNGALAITGWKEFTVLNYFQRVHGLRADLKVIVPARTPRRYSFGEVTDYIVMLDSVICDTPVFSTKILPEMTELFHVGKAAGPHGWAQVSTRTDCGN